MVYYLKHAEHISGFRFWLQFNTGEEGIVDLEDILTNAPGKLGKQFKDNPECVKQYYLDPWPTLAWKCGFDISPEFLYEIFTEQNIKNVAEPQERYNANK